MGQAARRGSCLGRNAQSKGKAESSNIDREHRHRADTDRKRYTLSEHNDSTASPRDVTTVRQIWGGWCKYKRDGWEGIAAARALRCVD